MADLSTQLFGVHAAALGLREARLNLIASNLANADTPNYQARDLDFSRALEAATAQTGITEGLGKSTDPVTEATVYRVPLQPSLDGNTVDADYEHASFARAALEYRASLSFVEGRVRSLMTAITGE